MSKQLVREKVPIGYNPVLAKQDKCPQSWIDYYNSMPEGYDIELVRKTVKGQASCPESWLQYYKEMPRGYDIESAAKGEAPMSWFRCYLGEPCDELEGSYDILEYEIAENEHLNTDTYGVTEEDLDNPIFWINL
jgi:hypothetical protein